MALTKVFNKANETLKRKLLRSNMPQAEVMLWSKLKGKGLQGVKFRRQYSIEQFVVDFYSPKLKLAIELDGDSYFVEGADEYDRERQTIIEVYGIRFLRFTNREVHENLEGVIDKILAAIEEEEPPPAPPW